MLNRVKATGMAILGGAGGAAKGAAKAWKEERTRRETMAENLKFQGRTQTNIGAFRVQLLEFFKEFSGLTRAEQDIIDDTIDKLTKKE